MEEENDDGKFDWISILVMMQLRCESRRSAVTLPLNCPACRSESLMGGNLVNLIKICNFSYSMESYRQTKRRGDGRGRETSKQIFRPKMALCRRPPRFKSHDVWTGGIDGVAWTAVHEKGKKEKCRGSRAMGEEGVGECNSNHYHNGECPKDAPEWDGRLDQQTKLLICVTNQASRRC